MSEKLRIGNVYKHDEYGEIIVTNRDHDNTVYYRGVIHRDNAGVVSTTDWIERTSYDDLLGSVTMRDYPSGEGHEDAPPEDVPAEWSELAEVVKERDEWTCQGCGRFADCDNDNAPDWQTEDAELAAHHIVPLGCGGTNTLRNLITLCSQCHGRIHSGNI